MAQQTIGNLLKSRTSALATCRADDTVQMVVGMLHRHRVGALPVIDGDGRLVGIISERDIIRGLAERKDGVRKSKVSVLMTKDVAICAPATPVKSAAQLMDRRRIRHLPVVEAGKVVDMVSLRDVVACRLNEAELEADVLREYALATGGVSAL
ncbi:MAG: CBS domain-containing protein [Alphaproteobacteria bacterium]|nr:CBS domain-containing protein [Alphaproteobacteria bacterium]